MASEGISVAENAVEQENISRPDTFAAPNDPCFLRKPRCLTHCLSPPASGLRARTYALPLWTRKEPTAEAQQSFSTPINHVITLPSF